MNVPALARSAALALLAPLLSACSGCATTAPPPAGPAPTAAVVVPEPAPEVSLDGDFRSVEVATVGWDSATTSPVVLLREIDTGQLVPIWVGVAEAQAIAAALHEVQFPRPMTHDLMSNLLQRLDAHLDELLIHDVVQGTYFGLLKLSRSDGLEPLLVDARPSDGLALALRTGARIRVAKKILDETPDVDFLAPDEPEQVVRGLGLTVVAPTEALREELGLAAGHAGLLVLRAVGEAADKGIQRGDLLVAVGDTVVERPVDFLDALRDLPLGERVSVRYWRDGREHEVDLAAVPPERPAVTQASGKIA
jgi:bifunctional DNase/RNase